MKTTVVNIRQSKYDVYIGRAGHGHDGTLGNPFSVTRDGGRERAIALYREYFYKRLRSDLEFAVQIEKLRGKVLGCFCAPKSCHGDVIAEYLNRTDGSHRANVSDVSRVSFGNEFRTLVTVQVPWLIGRSKFSSYTYEGETRQEAFAAARKVWPTISGY